MSSEFFSSNTPDAPTPISSAGTPTQKYSNAAGEFDLKKSLERKIKSRKDQDISAFSEDDAIKRYYGDFSIESKRNARDLLRTHPEFGQDGKMRMNRVGNNTREVLPHDPTKTVEHGGLIVYQDQPQTSQKKYNNDSKVH
jgi:hypothetical protein